MGASATQVSLFRFSAEGTKSKLAPRVEVLAHVWNESLGGLAFDLRLTDHLADAFQATLAKKVKGAPSVRSLPRVMARLRSTAARAREVLSANKETPVYAESLHSDVDLKSMLSQDELHRLTADLYPGVTQLLDSMFALPGLNLTKTQVDHFVLFGGAVRMPRVQSMLKEYMGRCVDFACQRIASLSFSISPFSHLTPASFLP
jgi:molecular chaperone DnaK (HSP70)